MITARIKPRPTLKAVVTRPYQGKGYAEGYETGYVDGYGKGETEGYNTGYEQGKTDGVASIPSSEEVSF